MVVLLQKMDFFDRVGVCICGGRKGEKAREREREKERERESMVRKRERGNSLKLHCYDRLYTYRAPILYAYF